MPTSTPGTKVRKHITIRRKAGSCGQCAFSANPSEGDWRLSDQERATHCLTAPCVTAHWSGAFEVSKAITLVESK